MDNSPVIIRNNISHCFWAMDVLSSISKNPRFTLTKSLFPNSLSESKF